MAEFSELRDQLRKSRADRDAALDGLARAEQELKRIAEREAALARAFNADRQDHIAARERLEAEKAAARANAGRFRSQRDTALQAEAAALKNFALLTDPREGIARLKDSTPILMMPVRLETRFKTVAVAGGVVRQLWVRVFPDDCWIDSFEATLTDTEVLNARQYWASIWQAGGIEDQERGAWRALVASHGSGRAAWIVEQFQPSNPGAKPVKARAEDVILTIPAAVALAAAEETATAPFWRDTWLANGDAAKAALAQTAFEAAVGVERASEIAARYVPSNFGTPVTDGVNVSVAFVILPSVETKQNAWAQAPKFRILPDRFVFIGYNTENDENPTVALGNPVPSPLFAGPDPSAPEAEQLRRDDEGNLIVPEELKWLTDFNRAVEVGMGFRINLTEVQATQGFKRVLVAGLRLNADEKAAKAELEALLRHHSYSRKGLAVVPQGTPTNNTEAVGAGFDRLDDPDQSFDDRRAPLYAADSDWLDKKDGQWIAEYLGIDPAFFANVHGADASDQIAARAMNTALWPATLGYWMETMMAPVFSAGATERTREFFNRYVIGEGAIPAIRIGSQPYGILPATRISRMAWLNPRSGGTVFVNLPDDPAIVYLRQLYPILLAIQADWRPKYDTISYVGKSGDPHALLLDIVGLHPGSVEWSQRYAENLQTLYNRLSLMGFIGFFQAIITAFQRAASRAVLTKFGYAGEKNPLILDKVFNGRHNLLKGGVVDDQPLSESAGIRAYTDGGDNYIQWLIDAAGTSLDALYKQDGFKDDKTPSAILYLLLRHALQLGYHDISVRLFENAGLFTAERALAARIDDPFLHIRDNQLASESRYQTLYSSPVQVTGDAAVPVHQFIAARITTLAFASYLREQLAALERLKSQPTGRLERAFADHFDCCAYRLDAWLLGIVNYQLASMRNIRNGSTTPAKQGIYLGAYGWLEDLKPENKVLTPVRLTDPDLVKDFGTGEPLMRDSTNLGYVHAPSLNHAVAAAVLRNGFSTNATAANPQTMAVNLTSERVRTALAMIEGIRAGQKLAELLGYQFERGLHDRHNIAEVDKFIYKMRKAFPLRADRMKETKTEEGVSIEAIEARNVIDGLAFVEHMNATKNFEYPFGKTTLPTATDNEKKAINLEADRLRESHDAVADLALSEGVYQAVLGNYDRVASTYDAYARGNFPPEPDVVRTPLNGIGLTHRVAMHLEAGADPNVSPILGLPMTPRAQGEPALNRWIAATFPPLNQVGCVVAFRRAATGADDTAEVTLRQLNLQPVDLLPLIRDDNQQAMTELDDRIVAHAFLNFGPRPDVPVTIRYMEKQAAPFSVFELMPLARNVRRLVTKSKPLRATDFTLMNEAESKQDAQPFVDKARLDAVRASMLNLRGGLALFQAELEGPLGDLDNRRGEILADVDTYVDSLVALLSRAATFVVPEAGWGFAYDFKRRVYTAILKQCADLVERWTERQAELIGIPGFAARFAQFQAIAASTRADVSTLLADVQALLPIDAFDFIEFTLTAHENEMVRFAEDALSVVKVIIAEFDRRLATSQDRFDDHDGAAEPTTKVEALEQAAQALLGADFKIIPEFTISTAQGDELENALNISRSLELFEHLRNPPDPATPPLDFPVDTWLHGVARVREKMYAWEQTVLFAGAMGIAEPTLDAMQLPYSPGDRWIALELAPDQKLDTDRLLYTAHFAAAFNKLSRQCGVLIDEWTEVIPTFEVDTGITFHHDRPNCEAPQSMLLAMPSEFRGAWQWNDLIGVLNETLDFAKRRAVEPRHIDETPYAPFLPATIMAVQVHQLTIAANLALNNKIAQAVP